MNNDRKYICDLCGAGFTTKSNYNRHRKKKKGSCISQERCKEFVEKIQLSESKLTYFENKTQQQKEILKRKESEIQQLKELVSKFSEKDIYMKESITNVLENVNEVKETLEESKQKFFTAGNQLISNTFNTTTTNNNYKVIDKKTLFNIGYTEPSKEKLSHITKDMLLGILNQEDFNVSLELVTTAIYFHPYASQNWRWCITDLNAKFGALEYNAKTGTLQRRSTVELINTQIQNAMYPLGDLLDELRSTTNLNKVQAINCNRMSNLLGNELSQKQVNSVKKSGYAGRNFPKALWDCIETPVETTPMKCQIKLP